MQERSLKNLGPLEHEAIYTEGAKSLVSAYWSLASGFKAIKRRDRGPVRCQWRVVFWF